MATVATTQQTREAVVIDGKTQFKITVQAVVQGPLPTKLIFLIMINDPTDPKADTFGRVASITDFSTYGEDRAQAVLGHQEFYRVDVWVFYYDDLVTAVNATDVLKTRVDELVTSWEMYDTQFETTSEVVEHPRTGLDTFNTLVDAYSSAATAETLALVARDVAKTTYETAVTNAATASTAIAQAEMLYNDSAVVKGYFDNCLAAFSTLYAKANLFGGTGTGVGLFSTNSKSFRDAADILRAACTSDPPTAGQKAAYDAALSSYNTQIGAIDTETATFRGDVTVADTAKGVATTNQGLFAAFCSARQTELNTAKTAKTTADTAVANTRTAYESAQAAYASAQMATEAALAAVRALKPTWTPTDTLPGSSTTA